MENPGNWNSEEKRLERKRRLESLKAKDGKKAPVESTSRTWKILKPVIAVVLVLSLGIWAAIQFSVPQRLFPPMTIGGERVSATEFSFYYSNTLSQFGIDPNTSEGREKLRSMTTMEEFEGMTWKEAAIEMTAQTIVEFHIQYTKAREAGIELTEEEKSEIDNMFDNLIAQLGSVVEADRYLAELFGKNVNVRNLRPVFEKSTLASKYAVMRIDEMEISDDKINEFYEENRNYFDKVTFRLEYFPVEAEADATEEERDEAKENARNNALSFLDSATSSEEFRRLSEEKAEEDERQYYESLDEEARQEFDEQRQEEEDARQEKFETMTEEERQAYESSRDNRDDSIIYSIGKSNIEGASTEMAAWLFEDEREYGQTEVFLSGNGFYAIYFVSREAEIKVPSARHILISPNEEKDIRDGDTFTAQEWEAARELANDVLSRATSLEAYIELVEEYSSDPGSVENEGLYEDITRNQMMPEFNDWVFDDSRQEGDMGIVRTDFGFHVMRFEGMNTLNFLDDSRDEIRSTLAEEKFMEQIMEFKDSEDFSYTISSFGVSLLV